MGYDIRTLHYGYDNFGLKTGSNITKIGLTDPLTFVFLQDNTVPLTFNVSDYTAKAVRFAVKESKDDPLALITKHNTADGLGGGDSQILVTSSQITVTIENIDTQMLLFDGDYNKYYWELKNITDAQTIAWGYIVLIKTTLTASAGSGGYVDNFMRTGTLAERDAWTPIFGYGIFICKDDNAEYYFVNGQWT